MKLFECEDHDRPIESYPGYLGHWFDGSLVCASELARLERTDIDEYLRLVDEVGETRCLKLALPAGPLAIDVDGDEGIHGILEQLKTIDVYMDNGPGDWGPASGGILLFFLAEGVSEEEMMASIDVLADAVDADMASLKARPGSS